MADDDEVDILGDFSFPLEGGSNLLDAPLISENSDLLNCDYTIHPQWLLDKPSANPDNWYEENSAGTTPDMSDSDTMGHVSTENSITDESGWTEKEKTLLQRGLEIFGKSSMRLAQFVGSKTASEVRYYLKNFFTECLSHYQQAAADTSVEELPECVTPDVLDSNQIPASIEEVIAVVSTGFPTVASPVPRKSRTKSSRSSTSTSYSPKKSSGIKKLSPVQRKSPGKTQTSKRPLKIKFKSDQLTKMKVVKFKNKLQTQSHKRQRTNSDRQKKATHTEHEHGLDANQSSGSKQITTGKGLCVPICEGEEIVTIQHADEDSSDMSIDVEDLDDLDKTKPPKHIVQPNIEEEKPYSSPQTIPASNDPSSSVKQEVVKESYVIKLIEDTAKELNSLEEPQSETMLDHNVVTELEKYVNPDFFEGRPSKTPERYLRIRNHIINRWQESKPNYVCKTSMRLGLKNCGDVSCISRIHYFLEQVGVINFGCEQTKYERPLCKMLEIPGPMKAKSSKQPKGLLLREPTELGPRQRLKKKFFNDGDGGCTMVHGENGEIIDTTIINEEPPKPRPYIKKPTIRLIYCRPFTLEKPQEYSVKISLSTIILMDFHSHSYRTEVMGLVGGSWDYHEGTLNIHCYEPCKNIASSTTHCDMCPISQARAAENIHNKDYDILGWFHSHPTFAPEPSQQDLDTQQFVQQWIGYGKPCIGVILSPFSVNAALISSPFRCWMVDKKPNFEDQLVPYRFKVDVSADEFSLPEFLDEMRTIILFTEDENLKDKRISFSKPYFQDFSITHLDKNYRIMYMESCRRHISKQIAVNGVKEELLHDMIESDDMTDFEAIVVTDIYGAMEEADFTY